MLSMSDFPEIRNLFKEYKINTVKIHRRYKKQYKYELIITNY